MQIDEAVQDLAVDMAKWLKKAKASTVQYPLQRPKQDKWEAGDPYDEYHSMEIFKRLHELRPKEYPEAMKTSIMLCVEGRNLVPPRELPPTEMDTESRNRKEASDAEWDCLAREIIRESTAELSRERLFKGIRGDSNIATSDAHQSGIGREGQ